LESRESSIILIYCEYQLQLSAIEALRSIRKERKIGKKTARYQLAVWLQIGLISLLV
jgi:hypothetical protein